MTLTSEEIKAKELKEKEKELKEKELSEAKAKAKEEADKKAAEEEAEKVEAELDSGEKSNDFDEYQKFATLKFLMWNGSVFEKKRLKPAALAEFEKLEKKFKICKGEKPKKSDTVVMVGGTENVRIVKGYGVPTDLYQMFVDEKKAKVYFD